MEVPMMPQTLIEKQLFFFDMLPINIPVNRIENTDGIKKDSMWILQHVKLVRVKSVVHVSGKTRTH
jgi:hypothetical protein